jgi:16S rRNA (guanine966-N2)-methyltransferase
MDSTRGARWISLAGQSISPQLYAIPMPRKPNPPRNSTASKGASAPNKNRDKPETTELRIIGGSMRGRKLAYSGDPLTRPMKDRVREAVFNLIGTEAKGKHALDLFAGTGALGLEAISRGATTATLLERHFPTADLIQQNCQALGVGDHTQVLAVNAFIWIRRELGGEGGPRTDKSWLEKFGQEPWLVFVSPPYDFYLEREAEMLGLIESIMRTAPPSSIIAIEADTRFEMSRLPAASDWDVRAYPPAVVAVWRNAEA